MSDASLPNAIANTPLGERLTWLLRHVREGEAETSDEEIEAVFATQLMHIEIARLNLERIKGHLPGATLVGVRSMDPTSAIATLELDGHTWDLGLVIEPSAPYGIRSLSRAERAPGMQLRLATETDSSVLREIELKVPVVSGDVSVVYDRGENYFEAEHMMGDALTHVVEFEGRPVGLTSWVLHPVRVSGGTMLGLFKHKMRLLKEARGLGARQMLDFAGFEAYITRRDVFYTYSAVANDNVHHIYGESRWDVRPERIVIDTRTNVGADSGRPATAADSARIVELLNRTHGHEEMFVPYTEESLAARLGRVPTAYSWPHLRISDRAVLGVWPAHLSVIRTAGGETTKDDRALVLDYGYDEGAEDEFIALIRAECAALTEQGSTELAIFTCSQATTHGALTALAKRIEPYMLHISIPPPDDLAQRGLYVDHLYF